jgi:hypothetical protein
MSNPELLNLGFAHPALKLPLACDPLLSLPIGVFVGQVVSGEAILNPDILNPGL